MQFKNLFLLLTFVFLLLTGLFFILVQQKIKNSNNIPCVVCTTTIIADAIKNIAENTINLNILMGPGVDPHTYKPIEQDIITISNADLIFYNGMHLEARMADVFAQITPNKKTVSVTSDMPHDKLIYSSEFNHCPDPHVWFDPELWIYAIKTITKHLQQLTPKHFDQYEINKNNYIKKIQITYEKTKKIITKIPESQRFLITGHDAFSYFARAYNCKVISLQGISTMSEAGTFDVQNLINFIIEHKIKTIFPESCIPTRNMQALIQGASAKNWEVHLGNELFSDALGAPGTKQDNYCDLLKYNAETIAYGIL